MDKMQLFCTHIRAALASVEDGPVFCNHARCALDCYETLPPEGQARARFYAARKAQSLRIIRAAASAPGGELAGQLLQKMQQPETIQPPDNE